MRRSVIKFLLCATFLVGAIAILTAPKANAAKVKVKKVKVNAPYAKKAYIAKGKSVKCRKSKTIIYAGHRVGKT